MPLKISGEMRVIQLLFLGKNSDLNESKFYEYAKKFMKNGATILGGCCEIKPFSHKRNSKIKIIY